MDKTKAAQQIIAHALKLVPFDGWNQATLQQAAIAAGYKKTDVIRVFPAGAPQAVEAYLHQCDEAMVAELKNYNLESMKIRERIALAVRLRLMQHAPHREATRRSLGLLALPFYAHRALKSLYATVDTIWYAIGDTSTDFNFYTKRATLAAVYSTTLLYWLDDKSPDFNNSWDFLARRIDNVMQFEKLKSKLKNSLGA